MLTNFNVIHWHLLQIFTWPACLSFTRQRCRSSCCPASAAIPTPTGNRGTKGWLRAQHIWKVSCYMFFFSAVFITFCQNYELTCFLCASSPSDNVCQDSGRWSLSPGDDLSSGVYSSNSQPDVQVFSVDLLSHSQLPPPCCFEGIGRHIKHNLTHMKILRIVVLAGQRLHDTTFANETACLSALRSASGVDVCIRDFHWRSIRIRETRRVKVGHIATGISDQVRAAVSPLRRWQPARPSVCQWSFCRMCNFLGHFQISEKVFTLETVQGHQVAHDEEVHESGLELRCVSAPDFSSAWRWRIRDGVLETR